MSVNSAVHPPTDTFGPYEVFERLGLGGMAVVHRAKKRGIEGFERSVALKRILTHLAENRNFVVSFIREAKVSSLLVHPNIAQVYDFGRIDGVYYIAMELVQGFDIRKLLHYSSRTGESVPIPVLLSILSEMADALDYAHTFIDEHGQHMQIVHRDISPSNLIVDHSGHLKVIDFGIAKASTMQQHTENGQVKGKLGYMSPEAALGMHLDPVSDLFSMGVVAWELVTASPLFSSRTDFETMWRIREAEIPPPSVHNPSCPPELDAVILAALERNSARRLPSAGAFRAALDALATRYGYHHSARHVAEWLTKFAQPGDAWVRPSLLSFSGSHPVVELGATNLEHRRGRSSPSPALVQRSPEQAQLAHEVWGENSGLETTTDETIANSPLTRSVPPLVNPSVVSPPPGPTITQAPTTVSPPYLSLSQSSEPFPRPNFPTKRRARTAIAVLAVAAAGLAAVLIVQTQKSAPTVPHAKPVPVQFVVEPADAVIEIAGHPVDKDHELLAGEHLATVTREGYKPWSRVLTVRDGQEQTVNVTLERLKAHVTIESEPSGLAIEIDGKPSIYTTPASFDQAPGTHLIVIRNGNEVWTKELVAEVDGKHTVLAKLTPVQKARLTRQRSSYSRNRDRDPKPEPVGKVAEIQPQPAPAPRQIQPAEPALPIVKSVAQPVSRSLLPKDTRTPVVATNAVAKLAGDLPRLKGNAGETHRDALVKMCIDTSGNVTSVRAVNSLGTIENALAKALSSWRYKPYIGSDGPSAVCFPLQLRLVFMSSD